VGSFGYRLGESDSKTQIHGYTTNEFIYTMGKDTATGLLNKPSTFDNHYFNVFVGSQIGEKIYAEIQFEYEHGGEEIQARYAQVDYKFSDALIIRAGKFLVPINSFNEFLYPEYINKAISRPFANRNIVPVSWAEVGVQLRGSFELENDLKPYYSVYVVNGLQGTEGGDIRKMRNNHRDKKDNNKSFGGKLGFIMGGLEIGGGLYTGVYTEKDSLRLTIGAFEGAYRTSNLTLRVEYLFAGIQRNPDVLDTLNPLNPLDTRSTINRNGLVIEAAYIIKDRFEPVVRYDFMNWNELIPDPNDPNKLINNDLKDKSRIYLGVNYKISNTMNFKVAYEIITNKGTDVDDNVLSFQLALGF
ncbi:MAG: hypothetical protein IIA88_03660, partial [Bacteroidetes bacterium]|nr:hypothetical protein [Bacteroidota bacterium]